MRGFETCICIVPRALYTRAAPMPALIVSIRPKYVERILSGKKTVELRKLNAKIAPGARVLIYSTSPCCAVVGEARIAFRSQLPIAQLWKHHGCHAAVDREEFDAYYGDADEGIALGLEHVVRYRKPVHLRALRNVAEGFRPPQSYMRVSAMIEAFLERLVPSVLSSEERCAPAA